MTCLIAAQCPEGWMEYDHSCYQTYLEKVSYQEAKQECIHVEAHLVTINDEAEYDFIRKK